MKAFVVPLHKQTALFQDALEIERRLQRELVGRALSPLDATFDLLEQTGEAMRGQAEAIEHAAQALEQAAVLMRTQAELFERTIHTLREPSRMLESAAGVDRAQARTTARPR